MATGMSMSLKARENDIIATIEQDLRMQNAQASKESCAHFGGEWGSRIKSFSKEFINKDSSVNKMVLRNFRARNIFVSDVPTHNGSFKRFFKRSDAAKFKKELSELVCLYEVAKEWRFGKTSVLDLLKKNPCNLVGNPNVFFYKGCSYTKRWLMRVWYLLLFRHFLRPRLESSFSLLDIGSNYGVFSYLLKRECAKCSQILLDFPEPLALAHYYLGVSFPHAKIATYKDVAGVLSINRDFIKKFDFILLPMFFYNKIERNTIDVVCSFASLGEMSREWFKYYMESGPFLSAKYFFCMLNQIRSIHFKTDLTIQDYRLDAFKEFYFRILPELLPCKNPEPPYFEFIGQRI